MPPADTSQGALAGRLVRRIATFLEGRGHEPRPFFAGFGLDLEALEAPGARVPYALVEEISVRAAELTRSPNVGLDFALTVVEPSSFDVATWMLMASATVGDALARAERFQRHWGDGDRVSSRRGEDGSLAVRFAHQGGPGRWRHGDECALAETVVGMRFMTGVELAPRLARFEHPAPSRLEQHAAIFRCPIEFEAPHTELVLDRETLALEMRNAHALYCRMFEDEVARAVRSLGEPSRLSADVEAVARAALSSECTLPVVAKKLGTSTRTLQRRLRAEGTSFDAILDAVRREQALALLERGVPRKEIAMLLGYAEPSAFHRAFKRWRGGSQAGAEGRRSGAYGH